MNAFQEGVGDCAAASIGAAHAKYSAGACACSVAFGDAWHGQADVGLKDLHDPRSIKESLTGFGECSSWVWEPEKTVPYVRSCQASGPAPLVFVRSDRLPVLPDYMSYHGVLQALHPFNGPTLQGQGRSPPPRAGPTCTMLARRGLARIPINSTDAAVQLITSTTELITPQLWQTG